MTPQTWIAFVSLLATTISGFVAILLKLGVLMNRIDMLWAWYLSEVGPGVPGGRRHYDPPAYGTANDDERASHNGK